jgi:hypothetical protein
MNGRIRKIAIITAMLFFATFATQAILFAHLLFEEHSNNHDSHKCAICQQLLVVTKNQIVEKQTTISQALLCEQSLVFRTETIHSPSTFHILGPRAPPAVS